MNPGALLDSIVGSKPKTEAKPSLKKRNPYKVDPSVKHEPFNQCPHCLVVNAYMIVLPCYVHELQSDGSYKAVMHGEGYFECKYCHVIDYTKGKGKKV